MSRVSVEEFLRSLAEKHGGRLTPALVVEAAKPKDSPIHDRFTWDVKKAAQERWIEQARFLIRSVRFETTTTQIVVRAPAFVRDPAAPNDAQGYVSLARLKSDEDMAREAVVMEFARASAALARAKAVAFVLGMSEEIEDVQSRITRLSERAHQEGPSLAA